MHEFGPKYKISETCGDSRGGGLHWVFSGPPRRQEMEATAVVLHLDLELELGFRMDPEEPGSLTFPLF